MTTASSHARRLSGRFAVFVTLCLTAGLAAGACGRRPAPRGGTEEPRDGTGASTDRGAARDGDRVGARFAAFAERFTRGSLALSPPAATLAGLHRYRDPDGGEDFDLDRELDDFSPAGEVRRLRFYRDTIAALDRDFPAGALGAQERIDRDIIAAQCRLALLDLEQVRSTQTNPTAAVESIGTALFFPVVFEYAPAADRAADVIARLEKTPAFVDQAIAALRTSAPIYTDVAIEENDGNRDVIQNALPALFPKGSDLEARYRAARGPALAAIDRLGSFLSQDLKPRSTGDWRLRAGLYGDKFRAYFQGDLDPMDVLRDAEAGVRRVRSEMLALATPLHDQWFPAHGNHSAVKDPEARTNTIVRETLDRIGRERPARDRLFQTIEADLLEIAAFLEKEPIVSMTRHDNLAVIETPPFLRGIYSVAGLNAAPPLEPGLKSLYYVTPIPKEWPDEKADSKLREYNRYKLLLLSMHEAMPGHYTQLEYANRVQPEWRRVLRSVYGNNAYIEGWAQYAEQVMLELGFHDGSDPRMVLTFRKEELRVLANAILDVRLHVLGMTDKEALDLMMKSTFQEKTEAEGKLRRAKLSSTQLPTYYVGWRAWRDLRRDAEARRGASFDLRAYHDEVLAYGAIPMEALRRQVLGSE
ncbi:MAG TPA: DUF885 domain-containing protein [Candidatus Polarisedimenticolia bacterium]|jgi:uncharacterized protein (DUF885 family)|nr:DUF885 domain-containing protein [Candidatus Polarisedimenticolia bacterium]